jgi:hypothetical protein
VEDPEEQGGEQGNTEGVGQEGSESDHTQGFGTGSGLRGGRPSNSGVPEAPAKGPNKGPNEANAEPE